MVDNLEQDSFGVAGEGERARAPGTGDTGLANPQLPTPDPQPLTPDPRPRRVVVAMSGGVDSSVAAALLVEQGYDVIGVMLRLWAEPLPMAPGDAPHNKCCSLEAVYDARSVAERLGIPFYVVNAERPFKGEVVDFFIREYAAGRTPNPCLACNRHIRFGYLLNYARSLGAAYLATGHYAAGAPR